MRGHFKPRITIRNKYVANFYLRKVSYKISKGYSKGYLVFLKIKHLDIAHNDNLPINWAFDSKKLNKTYRKISWIPFEFEVKFFTTTLNFKLEKILKEMLQNDIKNWIV